MPKKRSPNSVRIRNSTAEFLTFAYQTGGDGVEVRVEEGTIWLSQKSMGQLFETTPENVLMHLKNIFAENELEQDSVAKVFLATAADGKNYRIKHYNLDAIIAVGYRVNSKRATAFRQWATGVLRDYALRGYVMDRKRMENGAFLGEDYFAMEDWARRLDIFLSADEREVLQDAGRIRAEIAREHAEGEFEKYRVIQDRLFQSDFDTFAKLEKGDDGHDD